MKQKLWITLLTYLSYCVDKELYKAIDYLKEHVRILLEQQERQNKRILLSNSQRMRVAAKAKKLSRKMLEQCTVLFTPDTVREIACALQKSLPKRQELPKALKQNKSANQKFNAISLTKFSISTC